MSSPSAPAEGSPIKRKMMIKVGAILVVLLVIVGMVLATIKLLGGNTAYSSKDLVSVQTAHYSLSYPKQWQDASTNTTLQKTLGSLDTGLNDPKFYAYKVAKTNDYAQTILFSGDGPVAFSDSQVHQALLDPAKKQQLNDQLNSAFNYTASDVGCKSITNKQNAFQYQTPKFIIQITLNYDCMPQTTQAGKSVQYHVSAMFGENNSYLIGAVIETQENDWKTNATFYQNDVLASLQSK